MAGTRNPDPPIQLLIRAILYGVVLAYLGAVVWAGIAALTAKGQPALPEGVLLAITVFGGGLSTIFGATLGISKRETDKLMPSRAGVAGLGMQIPNWDAYIWVTYAYALSLLIAFVLLLAIYFVNPAGAPDVLRTMGSSIFGVGGAVLAIYGAPPKP
jgi:hypothetical protein